MLAGVLVDGLQDAPAVNAPALEPFAVAVARADGMLVPVGRFDGQAWTPMFAVTADAPPAPASLSDVPRAWLGGLDAVPAAWHLWHAVDRRASPFEERRGAPITTTGVAGLGGCPGGAGLTIGPAGVQAGAAGGAGEPIGLAVTSGTVRVDPLVRLEPSSEMGLAIVEKAASPFHRAEDDTIARESGLLDQRPPAARERRQMPVTWTGIARLGVAQAATRTFYLEGRKTYGPRLVMTGHVWLQMTAGRETADAEVDVDDAGGRMTIARDPIGTVRVGDRVFWLFRARGLESAAFEIVELVGPGRPPARVLTVETCVSTR